MTKKNLKRVISELKKCLELSPIEKDDFIKELSEKTGRSITLLKDQLAHFKKRKLFFIEF